MSKEHLDHLAAATAHAILNPDELERDHCIVLLRLVGDLTSTHIKLLALFDDPYEVAKASATTFTWSADDNGQLPLQQLFVLDPALANNEDFAEQMARELQMLGLIDTGKDLVMVFDRGLMNDDELAATPRPVADSDDPPHSATVLGRQVLDFVRSSPQP